MRWNLTGRGIRTQDRDLVYLLGLARKHELKPEILHDSLLAARKCGRVRCGEIEIEDRAHDEQSTTYMFSMNGKTLGQAIIQGYSITKLKRLPQEYEKFLGMREETTNSNKVSVASQIGGFRYGLRGLSFKARVVKKSDTRAVTSRDGAALLVCDVTLSDGTGEIPLAVWNNQISAVSEGDLVQVENASVRSFRGKLQLALSRKMGVLTVLKAA